MNYPHPKTISRCTLASDCSPVYPEFIGQFCLLSTGWHSPCGVENQGAENKGSGPRAVCICADVPELHAGWCVNPVAGPELPLLVSSKKLQHCLSSLVIHQSSGENYWLSTCVSHPSGSLCLPHLPLFPFPAHHTFLSVFFPVALFPSLPPFPPCQC